MNILNDRASRRFEALQRHRDCFQEGVTSCRRWVVPSNKIEYNTKRWINFFPHPTRRTTGWCMQMLHTSWKAWTQLFTCNLMFPNDKTWRKYSKTAIKVDWLLEGVPGLPPNEIKVWHIFRNCKHERSIIESCHTAFVQYLTLRLFDNMELKKTFGLPGCVPNFKVSLCSF